MSESYKLKPFSIHCDEFEISILLEVLTKPRNVDIHASGIEVSITVPYLFQKKTSLHGLVNMLA